jgi:hypothetical protein
MPDSKLGTVNFTDTPLFRNWLKEKGYDWERMTWWQRENAVAENMREGMTRARKEGQR